MSSVPPEKRCTTFLRFVPSETPSATPEDHGPTMKRAPSPSTASSARRVDVPACVAPSRVTYLIGRPRTFMSRSSSAILIPRSLSGPTSENAPVWSHRPRITISFDCARRIAGKPRPAPAAASAPIFRMSLRLRSPIPHLPGKRYLLDYYGESRESNVRLRPRDSRSCLRKFRFYGRAGLDRLRDGSLLGDIGQRRLLAVVQRPGERDRPRDAVAAAFGVFVQLEVDVNRAKLPSFARGNHAQRDRGACGQAREQEVVGGRSRVRAAARTRFVRRELVTPCANDAGVSGFGVEDSVSDARHMPQYKLNRCCFTKVRLLPARSLIR